GADGLVIAAASAVERERLAGA
ncbi:MAG: hypothetical protein QOF81_3332, partial [Acidimicrobiaceae bacterium]|nr:hypothetical protein [Acidimicrobiaceae bacterium]